MQLKAEELAIRQNEDITISLQKALEKIASMQGQKTLVLPKGEYYINSDEASKRKLFITNTIGDNEWYNGEEPHLNTVGIDIKNINDFVLDGNGSTFVIDGQMTNMAISGCKNVTVKNLAIRTINPDMHELKVVNKGLGYVDFEIDKESSYTEENGQFYFVGKDYKVYFRDQSVKAFWIGKIKEDNLQNIKRVNHPLLGTYKIKEIAPHKIRAYFFLIKNHQIGDRYYLFDVRRKYAGIFVERSENVCIENIAQHFNYSLAYVAQDSENLVVKDCVFAPQKDSAKLMASVADFMQVCMCRGQVEIKDNTFEGSGDDALNVHGIHFKITQVDKDGINVRFAHRQSHGFNPLRVGDKIRFVNPVTLLGDKYAYIKSSQLADEFNIRLTLDSTKDAVVGEVIEDMDARPDLLYEGNTMSRIITRGLLITTGGKVVVKNNKFIDTTMHSILISDDAKSWYESGSVDDVTIENNYFGKCPMYNVFIKPENSVHKGYVHHNITVKDNIMDSGDKGGIFVKSSDKVVIKNNTYKGKKVFVQKNSQVKYED